MRSFEDCEGLIQVVRRQRLYQTLSAVGFQYDEMRLGRSLTSMRSGHWSGKSIAAMIETASASCALMGLPPGSDKATIAGISCSRSCTLTGSASGGASSSASFSVQWSAKFAHRSNGEYMYASSRLETRSNRLISPKHECIIGSTQSTDAQSDPRDQ